MDRLALIVADPVKAMLIKVWSYVPTIFGAIIILVAGWIVAKFIEAIVVRALKAARLDVLSDKAGIANMLAQGDIKWTLSELIGVIIYWIVMLSVLAAALNVLNLTVAGDLLSRLVAYVPNIIVAIFVLVLGSFLASFIAGIVRTTASNAGLGNAKLLAKITQSVIIIFAVIIAIEQLNIATAFIAFAVNIILASIGLGAAIAFGLGCKDIAAKAMSDLMNKVKK
ncbi:MAG: hypothetical protein A3I73_03035 [Omnitrophica bacterium RIFCSPLOWO2_02_FULL_45_16]|nr:MAG: hypothetical protein A3G36_06380 [Omnitrophica bacterium RIFCSPLOWO2_12_FULL_45_13]OGX00994.1 MAG: hypothetical protein A3I73_03035 [Omnitrophica bacterium RIFCSPLOWO2_02_FULL_45_16]